MNLREVRKRAERDIWHHDPSIVAMAQYILATIDPSPDEPITAEWLREEWGFEQVGVRDENDYYLDIGNKHYAIAFQDDGSVLLDCNDADIWVSTRQQFTDLARCLGIPRRKDGKR